MIKTVARHVIILSSIQHRLSSSEHTNRSETIGRTYMSSTRDEMAEVESTGEGERAVVSERAGVNI